MLPLRGAESLAICLNVRTEEGKAAALRPHSDVARGLAAAPGRLLAAFAPRAAALRPGGSSEIGGTGAPPPRQSPPWVSPSADRRSAASPQLISRPGPTYGLAQCDIFPWQLQHDIIARLSQCVGTGLVPPGQIVLYSSGKRDVAALCVASLPGETLARIFSLLHANILALVPDSGSRRSGEMS